ncbi:hypothetical protein PROPHIGD54-2_153 [Mycobacterium phage prophiGD54-2]|nr:hypothetical protein PROPHIGD54-2_153 [Mycobacterium phage prophiGD54-2]
MDIVIWTEDERVDISKMVEALPYWVRSVRVYHRLSGDELGAYVDNEL